MNQEQFIIKLECYQTSNAPFNVKKQAIERLKIEFLNTNRKEKIKHILNDIAQSSAELKLNEISQ